MIRRLFYTALAISIAGAITAAEPKKVLLVTHSGGFIHDSVGEAEKILKEFGPKNGFDITCFRYTGSMDTAAFEKYKASFKQRTGVEVTPESCGKLNKETLKKFDVVLFFTTGSKKVGPLKEEELSDLKDWVKAGGAFCGTHCASDTMYESAYGDLIGGYFKTHPPGLLDVKLHLDDPKHPAAKGFADGQMYKDEIYVFTDSPYSRDKVHVIMSIKKGSFEKALAAIKEKNKNFNEKNSSREDGDYAISWVKEYGQGRVFYTSLGHAKAVWNDEVFRTHLFAGMKWAAAKKGS
jgi:type 1 glutamine amidotransferase